ncbi:MAG: hypothetical protein IIW34_01620 [Clostridia bacterium]|nr:hypothetical protein [Clostridia bacterium]MBQ2327063.1 hypothetical protein [Clostridia bacterium]MBQ5812833.1 hypothetical protein [Clostridia bacterium]
MKKLLSFLAVVLLLVYIGFQVFHNLSDQIVTIDAQIVTVEDKATCRGILVRSSTAVPGDTGKTYEFLVENGEKVSRGQQIAAYFASPDEAEAFRQAQALSDDIANAQKAYKEITSDDGGLTLDAVIFDSMEQVSKELSDGRVWALDEAYSELVQSVIAREYPRDSIADLEQSIASMQSELSGYKNTYQNGGSLRADTPGYFVRASEGEAPICTPDEMYSMTPDSLAELIASHEEGSEAENGVIGYIVDGFEWFYVCELPAEDAHPIESAGRASLSFPDILSDPLTGTVEKVSYFDDRAILILKCGYVDHSFLGASVETADVVKRSYTGIMVPGEALHQLDGQWGVYCLSGAVMKFKPIDWVYQGDGYYIAEPSDSTSAGLYLYDKMIIRGKNLEVNKVMK